MSKAHPRPLMAEALLAQPDDHGESISDTLVPTEAMVRQESMLINEVSLVLAEKRTALSVMRTGLSILVLPLSVLSVLIAISRYYDPARVIYLLAPLLLVCAVLVIFGLYLIYRSWKRTRNLEKLSINLKQQNEQLKKLSTLIGDIGVNSPGR